MTSTLKKELIILVVGVVIATLVTLPLIAFADSEKEKTITGYSSCMDDYFACIQKQNDKRLADRIALDEAYAKVNTSDNIKYQGRKEDNSVSITSKVINND